MTSQFIVWHLICELVTSQFIVWHLICELVTSQFTGLHLICVLVTSQFTIWHYISGFVTSEFTVSHLGLGRQFTGCHMISGLVTSKYDIWYLCLWRHSMTFDIYVCDVTVWHLIGDTWHHSWCYDLWQGALRTPAGPCHISITPDQKTLYPD